MSHTWQERFDEGYDAGVAASIELIGFNQDYAEVAKDDHAQALAERDEAREWAGRFLGLLSLADDALYDPASALSGSSYFVGARDRYRAQLRALPHKLYSYVYARGH